LVDPDAYRGVRAAAVPDRCLEHHVPPAVGGGGLLAVDVAVRRGHARAGALLQAARTAAPTTPAPRPRGEAVHVQRARARGDGRWLSASDPLGARPSPDG